MSDQRLLDYLEHIVVAADKVRAYTTGLDADAFAANDLVQDAVIHNVQIVGEASARIVHRYPEFTETHPELSLLRARAMRNVLVHEYSGVDVAVVWDTAQHALPELAEQVRRTLDQLTAGAT